MNQTGTLRRRAEFYAKIIAILFAKQNLAGGKLTQANRGARHLSLGIRLYNPSELDRALKASEAIALAANSENVIATRQAGLIVYQFQLASGFWQDYTRQDLPTNEAIGLAEKLRPVIFTVEDAPHSLVAGTTGSGKSETVKSILIGQMMLHKPDQLGIALIDPHSDYDDFHNASHLIAPIAQDPETIKTLLRRLVLDLAHRKENGIKDGKRLLIVVDEAHEVLSDSDNLALVQTLAQGRKFNIHLIVSTQKPNHTDLPKVLDNLDNRFIGKVTDAKVSATVTGQAGLEAHKLTGKGDFLHVLGAKAERFQVALATRQDFDALERCEVREPAPLPQTELALPVEPIEKQVGRPKLELNPEWLAYYFYHNPDKISHSIASDLGLTRTFHELHRDFAKEFIAAYLRLRRKAIGA